MRGSDERLGSLFSYVDLETRVPKGHPLQAIRALANAALSELRGDFAALYAPQGWPSITPEKLLRALLLQAFYSIRSERQLMERLEFDHLFRWFVGLGVVDARLMRVSGHAERMAALDMIEPRAARPRPITLAGDKGFDAADFLAELRELNVAPHIARNTGRGSAIDRRTTRHAGYVFSLRRRKRIEEDFGWIQCVAGLRQTKYRGIEKVGWAFTLAAAAYNLIRLPKLMAAT